MKPADTATGSGLEKDHELALACAAVALPNLHTAGRSPRNNLDVDAQMLRHERCQDSFVILEQWPGVDGVCMQ